MTTPEDAQANGFAEAFVKVMVKLVHTAIMKKQDPRKRGNKYLLAYRATPKIKRRKEEENRETKNRDTEDPDIDISIEEIRRRIRQEKEAAEEGVKGSQRLDESTDSNFTIT